MRTLRLGDPEPALQLLSQPLGAREEDALDIRRGRSCDRLLPRVLDANHARQVHFELGDFRGEVHMRTKGMPSPRCRPGTLDTGLWRLANVRLPRCGSSASVAVRPRIALTAKSASSRLWRPKGRWSGPMTTTITVRGLDPQGKSWLRREARARGVSMEALVRQFIHEWRERAQRHASPSDARSSATSGPSTAWSCRLAHGTAIGRCSLRVATRHERAQCISAGHQRRLGDDAA